MARHFVLLMTALVLAASAAKSPALSSEKNWIEVRCAAYRGDYCRVPFHVAMAHPEDLVRVNRVQLRGFLVRESEGFALYESRDSALRGWRSDALLISVPAVEEIQESLDRWNESLVRIRGRIVLVALDYDEYWVKFDLDSPVFVGSVRGEALKP